MGVKEKELEARNKHLEGELKQYRKDRVEMNRLERDLAICEGNRDAIAEEDDGRLERIEKIVEATAEAVGALCCSEIARSDVLMDIMGSERKRRKGLRDRVAEAREMVRTNGDDLAGVLLENQQEGAR